VAPLITRLSEKELQGVWTMKLKRDLYLEVSRKLQSSVRVKVFAFRSTPAGAPLERVCLGTLHMPEDYFRTLRRVFELGLQMMGARMTVGGSYFARDEQPA
jgi:hypothetical protein